MKKDKLMSVLQQAQTSGGSSAIKNLLNKMSSDSENLLGGSLKSIKRKDKSLESEKTNDGIDEAGPPSSRYKGSDKTTKSCQYNSPYITDDFLCIGDIHINDPDNKPM